MKKTIITALLSLGLAAAASALSIDDAIISYPDYDGTKTSFTVDDITGDYFSTMTVHSGTNRTNMTFTLVFNTAKLNAILSSTGASSIITASWESNTAWGLGTTADDKIVGWWGSGTNGSASNDTFSSYADADGTLTVTAITNNSGTRFLIGNADSNKRWTVSGLKFGANVTTVSVNSAFASAIEQLYVFDNTMSDTDAAAVYAAATAVTAAKAVPEPATATLSLLALAGLAARRRRK